MLFFLSDSWVFFSSGASNLKVSSLFLEVSSGLTGVLRRVTFASCSSVSVCSVSLVPANSSFRDLVEFCISTDKALASRLSPSSASGFWKFLPVSDLNRVRNVEISSIMLVSAVAFLAGAMPSPPGAGSSTSVSGPRAPIPNPWPSPSSASGFWKFLPVSDLCRDRNVEIPSSSPASP